MSNDGSAERVPLPRFVSVKTGELMDILVRDYGVTSSPELRQSLYDAIGEVVIATMDAFDGPR